MANLSNISNITIFDRSWGIAVQGNVLFGNQRQTLFDQFNHVEIPLICVEIKRQNPAERRQCVIIQLDFTSKKIQSLYQKIVLLKKIDTWANTVIVSYLFYPVMGFVAANVFHAFGASLLLTKAILIGGGALALAVPIGCGLVMLTVSLIGKKILNKLLIEINADIKKPPESEQALRPLNPIFAHLIRQHVQYLKPHFLEACRRRDYDNALKFQRFFQAHNCMPDLSEEENRIVLGLFAFERRRHALLGLR